MFQCNENIGMVMIFTLVSAAQDWLNSHSDNRRIKAEIAEEKRVRDEEEAERVRDFKSLATVQRHILHFKIFNS